MVERVIVIGKKFGRLTPYEKVLRRTPKGKSEIFYKCRCDCGNDIITRKAVLVKGIKTDCGCVNKPKKYKYIGERYGKLVVKERIDVGDGYYKYQCQCDCGKEVVLPLVAFVGNDKANCGCDSFNKKEIVGTIRGNWKVLSIDNNTDGRYICECIKCGNVKSIQRQHLNPSSLSVCMSCKSIERERRYPRKSRIYTIWQCMKARCKGTGGQNTIRYYAGRGIKYEPSWEKFENFYDDMKDGYADNLQLDRINPDGDYTKDNCRWITAKENCRNRRDNSLVTAGGETHVQAWWMEKYGVNNIESLRRCLRRDYGDNWEIAHGHRQNWLPTPRYHV